MKFLTLRNFPDDVSRCEDSGSEIEDLYTLELDADYFLSDESEQDISGSVYFSAQLLDRPPKRCRIQNQQPSRTEAHQKTDNTDAVINASRSKEESNSNFELVLTVHNPSPDIDDVAENRDVILTALVGTEWHQIYPGDYSAGRILQKNILTKASNFDTPYACRNMFA